jgi:hypothetical protein
MVTFFIYCNTNDLRLFIKLKYVNRNINMCHKRFPKNCSL